MSSWDTLDRARAACGDPIMATKQIQWGVRGTTYDRGIFTFKDGKGLVSPGNDAKFAYLPMVVNTNKVKSALLDTVDEFPGRVDVTFYFGTRHDRRKGILYLEPLAVEIFDEAEHNRRQNDSRRDRSRSHHRKFSY